MTLCYFYVDYSRNIKSSLWSWLTNLSFGIASVDVLPPPVKSCHHIQVRIVIHRQHNMFAVWQSKQDWGGLHGTHQDLVPKTETRLIYYGNLTYTTQLGTNPSCCLWHQLLMCDADKLLTCLWGGTAVSRWVRGSGTSGHSLRLEHPTAKQCCLWKHSQACGHLDSSYIHKIKQ